LRQHRGQVVLSAGWRRFLADSIGDSKISGRFQKKIISRRL